MLGIVTNVVGPLIVWLVKKDESPYLDDQGKEAINFNLTLLFAYLGVSVLSCLTFGIGSLLFVPVFIVGVIFGILGAVACSRGEAYRYPIAIRLVK